MLILFILFLFKQPDSHPTKGDNGDQVRERQSRQDELYHQQEHVSGPVYDGTRSYSNKNPSSSINYKDADKYNSGKHDYRKEDVDTSDVMMRKQQSGSEDPNYANLQRRQVTIAFSFTLCITLNYCHFCQIILDRLIFN